MRQNLPLKLSFFVSYLSASSAERGRRKRSFILFLH
jgi:hypothetical protein